MESNPRTNKTTQTQWARFVTIALIAGASRAYLLILNDMRIREDKHYARLLGLVEGREEGRALITVSGEGFGVFVRRRVGP